MIPPFNTAYKQTARLWDVQTGESKMEFRGHEHVLECAIFAPINSYQYIQELIGDEVRYIRQSTYSALLMNVLRTNQKTNYLDSMS